MLSALSSVGTPIPGGDFFFSPSSFTIGSDYQTLTPTKGTAPYTLTGTLPSNVTFTPSTGVLTGPAASQWGTKPIVSSGTTNARGIRNAVSSDGVSEFVVGVIGGTETFGAHTVYRGTSSHSTFVAKRSLTGWTWARSITGSGNQYVENVTATSDGGAVIVGWFQNNSIIFSNSGATFATLSPNTSSTGSNVNTGFIAKINASGDWVWANKLAANANVILRGVSTTSDGGFWVVGEFFSGSITATSPALTNTYTQARPVVIKYSSTGTPGNAVAGTMTVTNGAGLGIDVATASDGGAVITGSFTYGALTFGATSLTNYTSSTGYVAKVASTGTSWSWAIRFGDSSASVLSASISPSTNGDMIVGGRVQSGSVTFGPSTVTQTNPTYGSAFVAKISSTGSWSWAAGTTGTAVLRNGLIDVASSPDGGAYIVGSYLSGVTTFGSYSLPSATSGLAFVAKVSSSGAWQFASGWTGSGEQILYGVIADSTGARVTGSVYYYNVTIGTSPSVTFSPGTGSDVVSAKVDSLGNWLIGHDHEFPASVEISWSGGSQNVSITAF